MSRTLVARRFFSFSSLAAGLRVARGGPPRLTSLARSCRSILFFAPLIGAGIRSTAAAASVAYQVTDLGTLGGNFSQAFSINAGGQVTGWASTTGGERHAFLYDGLMHDLGTFIGFNSAGYGINFSGQVTGQDDYGHTFLWTPTTPNGASGTMTGLVNASNAQGINASGQVSGYFVTNDLGTTHAFLWTPTTPNGANGTLHDLGTLGGTNSYGGQINASGQITGFSETAGGRSDAFRWTPTTPNGASGTMNDLGTLGGTFSQGFGINASGQVAGVSRTTGGEFHAFLYDGTLHDLGTLGGNESNAQGINASGLVTGWASTPGDLINHAILYDTVHGMVDLNSLIAPRSGWELTNGIAINDAGEIAGFGTIGGETHGFLLTPVPHILPGDANGDGVVNFSDLLILAQNYGKAGGLVEGDFNSDGAVGFDDLLILAQHYGEGAAAVAAPVPEPSSAAAVVGLAAAGLWRARRGVNRVV